MNTEWCIQHFNPLATSIGILFDIIGAWLVAWEVIRQYKGKKFAPLPIGMINPDAEEQDGLIKPHPLYETFEANKYRRMKWGLGFLTLGFVLQILPNLFQIILH